MTGNSSETNQLLEQAALGDRQGLGTLLAKHGDRLREHLTRAEIAQVLGVTEGAGGKRYIRALERLKRMLGRSPGALRGQRP
jgi:DNA-directed RNA polymerase specialized sigma24 family protein